MISNLAVYAGRKATGGIEMAFQKSDLLLFKQYAPFDVKGLIDWTGRKSALKGILCVHNIKGNCKEQHEKDFFYFL